MIKHKKTILAFLSVAFVTVMLLGASLFFPKTAKAEPLPAEDYRATNSCVLDSVFELPKRSYTLNDETKEAKTVLVSPTEIAYDCEQVVLNEAGVWTLEFSVDFDKRYVFTEEFTVNKYTYEVTSGSVSVGRSELFPDSGEGLLVQINKDAEFRYNEIIDLRGKTSADNILEFGFMPAAVGTAQVSTVYITLTDIYNPDNYARVIVHNPNNKDLNAYPGTSTLAATFAGQEVWLGHQHVYDDGRHYIQSTSPYYGTYTRLSFDGYKHTLDRGADSICQISYDYEDKAVFTNTKRWGRSATGKYKTLIADLDDLDYSNTKLSATGTGKGFSEAFSGFTTGEVYLSISCEGYVASTCGFFIKSICDADFSQVKTYDYAAPILTIDTEGYSVDALPEAEVGRAYKIFDAFAVDNVTIIEPSIKVYYMRGSSKLSRVSIVNGTFTPTIAGKYCIEYSAVDGSGNQTAKTLYLNAVADVALPELEFIGVYEQEGFVGTTITFADAETISYSGNAVLLTQVLMDGEIVAEGVDKLTVLKEGTYLVKYLVQDYLGQDNFATYSITVVKSNNPIIATEPVLPKALLDGATYTLPIITAKDYFASDAGEDVVSTITVLDGDGTRELNQGSFTVKAGNRTTAIIRYEFVSASGSAELVYELPIVEVENFENDLVKYFVASNGSTVTQLKNSVLLSYTNNSTVDYIKSIPLLNTRFIFHIYNDGENVHDNGKGIEVVLTDTLDKTKQIRISLTVSDDSGAEYYYLSVNGGKMYMVAGNFYTDKQIDFYYNNVNRYVKIASTVIYLDDVIENGAFEGFSNEQAYLSIRAVGVDEAVNKPFGVELLQIDTQPFAKTDADYIAPVIVINGETESQYEQGSIIQTFTAFGIDILQENVSCTMTVTDPSGEIITDINNKPLSNVPADAVYAIKLEQYGNYRIRYTAVDSAGRKTNRNLLYYVADLEMPTITIAGTTYKCKVNQEVKLPSITISDNVTSVEKLVCYVMYKDPNGRTYLISDVVKSGDEVNASFKFNQVGKWTITYLVYDENFNVTMQDIDVFVEA